MTAILENTRRFIERLAPAPACDACLEERLAPGASEAMRAAIAELSGTRGFMRDRDICGLCGEDRMVIRSKR